MSKNHLEFSHEVIQAKQNKQPIVALESTVISHGLPYPSNIETTMAMQEAIQAQGVVPAIIGLLDGKIKIGLNEAELQIFSTQTQDILKLNRADIAYCLSKKLKGATTVSATAYCATLAGINIFATGGIGGVHRGAELNFDISCDLTQLSNTPVMVVCSGAKSILDIPKTLEYLETMGVPVAGYQCETMPLFFSAQSPYPLTQKIQSVIEAATYARCHFELDLGGIILANPIPQKAALDYALIEKHIATATQECKQKGIIGKRVTPYILNRLRELTDNKTLIANNELLINNAKLAAQIAYEYQHGITA